MKLDLALTLTEQAIHAFLARKERMLLAVDGRCASGKTTFATALASRLACPVIPCDAFFLPPEKRTAQRLSEIGGNMDRERLLREVLLPWQAGQPVTYRPFDCTTLSLADPVFVFPASVTVIEGSYACHEELMPYYDAVVFLDVTPEEQKQRLLLREKERASAFFDRWIPLEEPYFRTRKLSETADLSFFLD